MNLTTLLKYGADITSDTPIGERAIFGLEVVGIGMGVVFGVLLILIGILQLFKLFAVKKPAEQTNEEPISVATSTPAVSAPSTNVPSSEEETVVAVATAAIAASRGESECAFNIISIKKIVK